MKRTHRLLATRTIDRRVITTSWLALEKCLMMLDKLFKPRLFRKLGLKLANSLFKCGVLCFQFRHLLFECCCLRTNKVAVLVGDDRRAVLNDQLVEVFDESHKIKTRMTPNEKS